MWYVVCHDFHIDFNLSGVCIWSLLYWWIRMRWTFQTIDESWAFSCVRNNRTNERCRCFVPFEYLLLAIILMKPRDLTETPKYEKSRTKTVFYLKSTSHHVFPKDRKRPQKNVVYPDFLVLLRSFANFAFFCGLFVLVKWIMTAFLKPRTMHWAWCDNEYQK